MGDALARLYLQRGVQAEQVDGRKPVLLHLGILQSDWLDARGRLRGDYCPDRSEDEPSSALRANPSHVASRTSASLSVLI